MITWETMKMSSYKLMRLFKMATLFLATRNWQARTCVLIRDVLKTNHDAVNRHEKNISAGAESILARLLEGSELLHGLTLVDLVFQRKRQHLLQLQKVNLTF